MKALLMLLIPIALAGCTKHKLQKFNNRIVGDWKLVEINTFGLGSSHIVFNGGSFSFNSDNSAVYYHSGDTYRGDWFIDAYTYTDGEGDSDTEFILSIDVAKGSYRKFDSFEIPRFGNANRFKAKVRNGLNTVTYIFERR
ncbi:hypothetical protein ABDK00_005670 [Niabella insulamsoli]|uniref:hypothetical protein n=1 Tax=Niabella insulamsoli TaxID=3144874 RepID=UPI0031FCF9CC